jgi:hypothetical protein
LTAAGHFNIPELASVPLFDLDGTDVQVALEGETSYLLIDHRGCRSEREAARIELWDAVSAGEVERVVLLAICDAGSAAQGVTTALTLSDVVAALRPIGGHR